MNRRQLLKKVAISLGTATVTTEVLAKEADDTYRYALPTNPLHTALDKPVTAITMGAGGRGMVYGGFAEANPDFLKIVGVAEPIPFRNDRYAKLHKIDANNRFVTWEDVLKRPKFADAVIISMPDHLHYVPCMQALEAGYDVLLEKPIAQTAQQCRAILRMAKKTGRIVAVCHVLRYAPYFVKMRELLAKGAIGEVISVQHLEPIEHVHMAHAYVRGNWHRSTDTTPIILSKSCHDLDIIKWVLNKRSLRISAMGDLKWFRQQNAPEGSTARCTDGCKVENQCPYSAVRIYADRQIWTHVLDIPTNLTGHDAKRTFILEKLKTTDYGRCVYRMDNDQPDHYVTNILFEDNVTASFSMEAFTAYGGRRTRIMGAMGDMEGDMNELIISDFRTGKQTRFVPTAEDVAGYKNQGHGGGDWILTRDFCQAVAQRNPALLTSAIDDSIESHIMGFMAEESRKTHKVMPIKL